MAKPTTVAAGSFRKEMRCEELAIDIPLVMELAQWPECCIYKVPKKLREVKKEAYTPKLISIGPLHHGEYELLSMQMLKLNYLREFCYRAKTCHEDIARFIEEKEQRIRRCYKDISDYDLSSEDFVNMVVLDSIFIIELFLRSAATDRRSRRASTCGEDESYTSEEDGYIVRGDCIASNPLLRKHIQQDLLLLENQLPFFILDELHTKFSWFEQNKYISFVELTCNYLFPESKTMKDKIDKEKVKHFTDLMRYLYHPPKDCDGAAPIKNLHNAKKLEDAGVILEKDEKKTLLDIDFQEGDLWNIFPGFIVSWILLFLPCLDHIEWLKKTQTILKVPVFEVNDETEGIFRNVMALEQCHYPDKAYICNYFVLLDYLINTRDDVELLVEKGIIVNKLGSYKAVATMVNRLCLEITGENHYYIKLVKDINDYYEDSWNRNMGYLRTVYFRDVWRGTATVVGVIVLFVTFLNFLRPFVFKNI
ncbi:UPF0481 protein At3g47200-like [Quercus lobata]|uniref:Uncharacterized protein n=1 Tax=Quercus lobata TaxID=97700 RepID=A0A7N2R2X9_QUELO|nr:UPF0481 protein At3g47200-like [Quercus lobata]